MKMDPERARLANAGTRLHAYLTLLWDEHDFATMDKIADDVATAYRNRIAEYILRTTMYVFSNPVQLLFVWAFDAADILQSKPGQEWIQQSSPVKTPTWRSQNPLCSEEYLAMCQREGWTHEHAFARKVEAKLRQSALE